MSDVYKDILQNRSDITEWLIHFTRDQSRYSARDVLLKIITEGALRPSRSIRDGKPTIYGGNPAVCFTEQPLFAFGDYVNIRNNTRAVSGYGILIHKNLIFGVGGRPVIYELGSSNIKDRENRILEESCLPISEQYRYVTFNPTESGRTLDWTHEREWRWPKNDYASVYEEIEGGLELWNLQAYKYKNIFENGVHILVKHKEDINWIKERIDLLDSDIKANELTSEYYAARTEWYKKLRSQSRIISLDEVQVATRDSGDRQLGRFEGWALLWNEEKSQSSF